MWRLAIKTESRSFQQFPESLELEARGHVRVGKPNWVTTQFRWSKKLAVKYLQGKHFLGRRKSQCRASVLCILRQRRQTDTCSVWRGPVHFNSRPSSYWLTIYKAQSTRRDCRCENQIYSYDRR